MTAYNPQDPPPVYEDPSSYVYETPQDGPLETLPAKDKLTDGAVVYILPSTGVAGEKPTQDKPTVGYPHQKSTIPNAYYVPGDRYSGAPDAELRLVIFCLG